MALSLKKTEKYQGLHRMPYGTRLIFSYVAFAGVAIISLGGFGGSTLMQENRRVARQMASMSLDKLHELVSYKLQEIDRICEQLLFNPQFQQLLVTSDFGAAESLTLRRDVIPSFSALVQRTSIRMDLVFLLQRAGFPAVEFSVQANSSTRENRVEFKRLEDYGEVYLRDIDVAKLSWSHHPSDGPTSRITFGRRIVHLNTFQERGFLIGYVEFDSLFTALPAENEYSFLVTGPDGLSIFPEPGVVPTDGVLLLSRHLDGTPWDLTLVAPEAVLNRGAMRIVLAALIASSMVAVLTAVVGMAVARAFNRRINSVVGSIKAFEEGDFRTRIKDDRDDEFGSITRAFNGAAETIDTLIDRVYTSELEKRDTELRLLQAQIHPHFLYNSLGSISNLARLGRGETVHRMVLALSRFYRLALNDGRDKVSLNEEFERVKAYLDVQSIKYEARLISHVQLDPAAASVVIPHLLLQPFVENAIEHAWRDGVLRLRVSAVMVPEDRVEILVSDDGAGMTSNKIDALLSQSHPSEGYGIFNTVTRLRLAYGDKAQLSVKSQMGQGTCVILNIPKIIGC